MRLCLVEVTTSFKSLRRSNLVFVNTKIYFVMPLSHPIGDQEIESTSKCLMALKSGAGLST
jgi:hypothetical protein